MNLANTCNNVDNATFPGSQLPNCQVLASDIQACQAKGKVVTLSLGGATGGVGFTSDAQAQSYADQVSIMSPVPLPVFLIMSIDLEPFSGRL